jgi:hypothetical protein
MVDGGWKIGVGMGVRIKMSRDVGGIDLQMKVGEEKTMSYNVDRRMKGSWMQEVKIWKTNRRMEVMNRRSMMALVGGERA